MTYTSAVQAIGKQAGVGFMQRVAAVVELGSLCHRNTFILCRYQLASQSPGGGPPAAWQGSDLKNPKTRNRQTGSVSMVGEITERMLHYRRHTVRWWGP